MQLSSPVTDIQGLIVRDDTKKEVVVALRGRSVHQNGCEAFLLTAEPVPVFQSPML